MIISPTARRNVQNIIRSDPVGYDFNHMNFDAFHDYVYSPLGGGSIVDGEYIRLIELKKQDIMLGWESVRCRIRHVPLSAAASMGYQALSYCWGDATKLPGRLIIESDDPAQADSVLHITSDLEIALKRLRRNHCLLWVDAVCINQADNLEKNAQVQLMGRIYRSARSVVVWLGDENDDSTLGLPLVPRILEANRKLQSFDSADRGLFHQPWKRQLELGLPPPSSEAYKALLSILKRPWFQRVWVVQELALASDSIVLCGREEFAWADFVTAVLLLVELTMKLKVAINYSGILAINDAKVTVAEGREIGLFQVLLRHRLCGATDPRDKVYALCGLSNDAKRLGIIPDYSESVSTEMVYTEVAIAMLSKTGKLDIFSASRPVRRTAQVTVTLPSWVPD